MERKNKVYKVKNEKSLIINYAKGASTRVIKLVYLSGEAVEKL